jgi:S1-C subfamily serine protease
MLGVVIGLVACATAPHAESEERPEADACPAAVRTIYARIAPAVVAISGVAFNPYDISGQVSRTVGTGVIIDASGLVLTNAHVVLGQQALTVTRLGETAVPGEVVGTDPLLDLAVVRIPRPARGSLPTLELGRSGALQVGDVVLAIGTPLGLDQTLTTGVVSALDRREAETPFTWAAPVIQTDAPINPGHSGGPLLTRCGEFVGVTTAILAHAQNIGFAIPIDLVKGVLPDLLRHGRVIRPWLGIDGHLVTPALKEMLGRAVPDGLLVEVVEPESPAARAEVRGGRVDVVLGGDSWLLGGDVLTQLNGHPVTTAEELTRALQPLRVGDTVHLTLVREGQTREVEFVLPERPVLPQDLFFLGSGTARHIVRRAGGSGLR